LLEGIVGVCPVEVQVLSTAKPKFFSGKHLSLISKSLSFLYICAFRAV
jgi:hypothetical protein